MVSNVLNKIYNTKWTHILLKIKFDVFSIFFKGLKKIVWLPKLHLYKNLYKNQGTSLNDFETLFNDHPSRKPTRKFTVQKCLLVRQTKKSLFYCFYFPVVATTFLSLFPEKIRLAPTFGPIFIRPAPDPSRNAIESAEASSSPGGLIS